MKNNLSLLFSLTKRHFTVFFTNKIRLLYTLLVPVLILLIYILVLRNLELTTISNTILLMPEMKGLTNAQVDDIVTHSKPLVDSWMLSGIVALSVVCIAIQCCNIIVEDKENGVNRDFIASPVNRKVLTFSYFLFVFLLTFVLSLIIVLFAFVYLAILGEFVLNIGEVFFIFAILIFTSIASVLLTVLIATFVNREATLASIIAVFSTAVGFLIGAYMPLSMFPKWLSYLCCLFPGSYGCSLLRFSFLNTPVNIFSDYVINVAHIPNGDKLINQITTSFGYNIDFFGLTATPWIQAVVTAGFILILLIANILCSKHLTKVISGK